MIIETSAGDLRKSLGELLEQVQYRHDSIVINKRGKPVAVLIDVPLFKQVQRMRDRFDGLCTRVAIGFAQMSATEGVVEINVVCNDERSRLR
jgi:prevent-host-death family protein